MEHEEALARANSWISAPRVRPAPMLAKEVAVALAQRVEQLESAIRAVLRDALDEVPVRVCDAENDAVRAKGLHGSMAQLYDTLNITSERREPAQLPGQVERET